MTLTLLGSCQNEIIAKFEIKNMTNETIDSISIKSFDHQRNSEFIQLKSGESKSYWLDMTKLPKVDGEYLLTFRRNMTNKELKRFGYFTNGYPLEEVTNIQFKKDTILIKQVSNSY
tara:strand:- start:257 stop:604 length:348 start_codon:yes stop_codon:yes gene_type:complete